MRHTILSLLTIPMLLMSCGKSASDSGSITVDADSVTTAMDTAHALPDTITTTTPQVVDNRLDSLASAETTINYMKNSGHWDAYQAGIIPSILEQNLDYARRLLRNQKDHFIIVDKQSMNVILYDKYGREKKCYLMACSRYFGTKHKRRDNRTPEGFFSAEGIYNSTDWLYTNDDGYTSPARGQFGPRFIRLKTPVTSQVGIHGTAARHSPGKRCSHGCIRIQNEQILELVKFVSPGTPIIVNPSDRDRKVNEDEGYSIPQINIGKGTYSGAAGSTQSDKASKNKDTKQNADSTASKPAAEKTEPAQPTPSEPAESPAVGEPDKATPEKQEPAKNEPATTE